MSLFPVLHQSLLASSCATDTFLNLRLDCGSKYHLNSGYSRFLHQNRDSLTVICLKFLIIPQVFHCRLKSHLLQNSFHTPSINCFLKFLAFGESPPRISFPGLSGNRALTSTTRSSLHGQPL